MVRLIEVLTVLFIDSVTFINYYNRSARECLRLVIIITATPLIKIKNLPKLIIILYSYKLPNNVICDMVTVVIISSW